MYDKLNDLYNHEIISTLLKNDVIIYGKFVRNIVIENMSLNDFFSSGTGLSEMVRDQQIAWNSGTGVPLKTYS